MVREAYGDCDSAYRSKGSEGGPVALWGTASSRARAWCVSLGCGRCGRPLARLGGLGSLSRFAIH